MPSPLLPALFLLSALSPHDTGAAVPVWIEGPPPLESIGELAVGPEGVLFLADPMGAAIYALRLEPEKGTSTAGLFVEDPGARIAVALGTTEAAIQIQDMAVVGGAAYLSVTRGQGESAEPVLVRIDSNGEVHPIDFESAEYMAAEVPSPASGAQRSSTITDLVFTDGHVFVAGLSNEEFASTLRSLAFPFDQESVATAVEIYHGNHGTYETHAPVRTFVAHEIEGEPHLVAAYTCTPLVTLPTSDLASGGKVRGRTVAELGGGNVPLDMLAYEKDGQAFLLVANSRHGVMKIAASELVDAEHIETQMSGRGGVEVSWVEDLAGLQHITSDGEGGALALIQDPQTGTRWIASVELP